MKPKTMKIGAQAKYPWHRLKKVGDYFLVNKVSKTQSCSLRTCAVYHSMRVSVKTTHKGDQYLVERVA